MAKFIADESFFEIFPKARLGVMLLDDFTIPEVTPDEIKDELSEANQIAKKYVTNPKFTDNPVVKEWREAYQNFKKKKGARCAIEALLKRVENDNYVTSINSLVDILNTQSLIYALPTGTEDRDKIEGDMVLKITQGGDEFYPIGEEENSPTLEGELAYLDDKGAVCRCFNWRDGERTMITDDTKSAIILIEILNEEKLDDLTSALNTLEEKLTSVLGAKVRKKILSKNDSVIEF